MMEDIHNDFLTAIREDNRPKAMELLQKIPDPYDCRSPNGESPLHWASDKNNTDLIRALVAKGCYIGDNNYRGAGPLIYAAISDSKDAIKLLLELGADPREVSAFSGMRPDQYSKSMVVWNLCFQAYQKQLKGLTHPAIMLKYGKMKWIGGTYNYLRTKDRTPDQWTEFTPIKEYLNMDPLMLANTCHIWSQDFWNAVEAYRKGQFDETKECGSCLTKTNLKRCRGCQQVWFCGYECQLKTWIAHKKDCSKRPALKWNEITNEDIDRIPLRKHHPVETIVANIKAEREKEVELN